MPFADNSLGSPHWKSFLSLRSRRYQLVFVAIRNAKVVSRYRANSAIIGIASVAIIIIIGLVLDRIILAWIVVAGTIITTVTTLVAITSAITITIATAIAAAFTLAALFSMSWGCRERAKLRYDGTSAINAKRQH
jgi:hypothetical protein